MNTRATNLLTILFILCLASEVNPKEHQIDYTYKNQGDRCEGKKGSSQKAGNTPPVFELVSARIEYNDDLIASSPKKLKVAFYSPQQSMADLIVREIKPIHSYWMTRSSEWKVGFGNVFEWSTQPFLDNIGDGIKMYELGVVVKLNEASSNVEEVVAPAIFYHTKPARSAGKYSFVFVSTVNGKINLALYQANEKVVKDITQGQVNIKIGTPLAIPIDLSRYKSGDFRLKGEVEYSDNKKSILKLPQNIRFHHEPNVPNLDRVSPVHTLTLGRCL